MSNDPSMNTALLNFCTSVGNGPKEKTEVPKRSAEEMQWLKEALESVEAPERKIQQSLALLTREDVSESECLTALEEMSDLVEDISWAIEFSLMSGHRIILDFLVKNKLATESEQVRQAAAMVIAHAAQLNEAVQKCFEEAQWQDVLLPLLKKEESPAVVAALLHSCSCLCRDYAPNAILFNRAGGITDINRLLEIYGEGASQKNTKITRRLLFLVAYLAEVVEIDTNELIPLVCRQTTSNDDDVQTAAARCLCVFANKHIAAVRVALHEVAPNTISRWRSSILDEDDSRQQLLNELDREGHEG
ncbi:uncharacterized protein TM35_000013880 [Trypanosoma theileri]|uniref:Uncharacterized protein n=1 Tax=Trypanosoma theileri TaxID=67003 RepID=A0A1X0P9K1_9TRYP|nr:uncharacterized protein TM35_000013880 [Trypanosoma theileri]ORC93511.1 hypothetical protein TM35_000013880 [Trypanosoma theileri]